MPGIGLADLLLHIVSCVSYSHHANAMVVLTCRRKLLPYYTMRRLVICKHDKEAIETDVWDQLPHEIREWVSAVGLHPHDACLTANLPLYRKITSFLSLTLPTNVLEEYPCEIELSQENFVGHFHDHRLGPAMAECVGPGHWISGGVLPVMHSVLHHCAVLPFATF